MLNNEKVKQFLFNSKGLVVIESNYKAQLIKAKVKVKLETIEGLVWIVSTREKYWFFKDSVEAREFYDFASG